MNVGERGDLRLDRGQLGARGLDLPPLAADALEVARRVGLLELGDAKVLAAAIRVGSTRLIDNVLLEGELA